MTLEASPIPLIDLSTGASTEELAKAIASAVSSVGFLHVKLPQDGGLSVDSVRRAFAIVSQYSSSATNAAGDGADNSRVLQSQVQGVVRGTNRAPSRMSEQGWEWPCPVPSKQAGGVEG